MTASQAFARGVVIGLMKCGLVVCAPIYLLWGAAAGLYVACEWMRDDWRKLGVVDQT